MKKALKVFGCLLVAAMLFSCKNPAQEEAGKKDTQQETKSLTEKIADESGSVDLKNEKATEDVEINSKITIKNLDMDGNTLIINASGVELENIKNAIIVFGGKSENLIIDDSQIESIEIKKDGIKIILKDDTTVEKVSVEAKGTTIDSVSSSNAEDAKTPAIETITLNEKADGVTVSGGSIEKVEVEAKEETEIPSINITGKTEINDIAVTVDGESSNAKVNVNVSADVSDKDLKLPENNVEKKQITVISTTLDVKNAKKDYTVGDKFDYSGLYAVITYNNGSTKSIPLTSENSDVTGFSSTNSGEYMVKIGYQNLFVTIKIAVKSAELTTGTAEEYIQAAIEKLAVGTPDVDGAVAYLKKAYETEKTDETKLYYALAELASISTDASVAKLLKENFGFKNYPAKMNSLFSGSWMKEYMELDTVEVGVFEKNETGGYLRVNGTVLPAGVWEEGCTTVRYTMDEDKDWIKAEVVVQTGSNSSSHYDMKIKDIEPSADGKYLILISENTISNNNTESPKTETAVDNLKDYYYKLEGFTYKKAPRTNRYDTLPEWKVPDGIENNEYYKETLYKSVQTSETMAYLMLMNIFTCNATGFNSLVDNILGVFGTRYEHAKSLVSDINEESIEIPSDIIAGLNLGEWFGEATVMIGKSEVDVLFAAGDIVKGLFQWISSYDLSMNIGEIPEQITIYYKDPNGGMYTNNINRIVYHNDNLENDWMGAATQYFSTVSYPSDPYMREYCRDFVEQENQKFAQRMMGLIPLLVTDKTLSIRNESAMTASKNTIVGALNTLLDSYTYITEKNKSYPSAVKDMIKKNCDGISKMVAAAAEAIENGETFSFPSPMTSVRESIDSNGNIIVEKDEPMMLSVDFGKLFEAGYFSELLVEGEEGSVGINMNLITDLLPFLAQQAEEGKKQ